MLKTTGFISRLLLCAALLGGLAGCDGELERRVADLDAQAAANLEAGQAFLAENAAREGVQQTESGLQYRVIRAGEGATPGTGDRVRAHYRGTLIDGTQFDSSYDRGHPAEFPVNRLIPGWTEALQLMREGAQWTLYVPAHLAYGKRSPSSDIPPNSTLVFDLELLEVLPAGGQSDG